MNASPASVALLQVGDIAPLGPRGIPSGFIKHPVDGRIAVVASGLAGDAQADRRVHGAPDKAVYAYPFDAYSRWRTVVPRHADRLCAGAMGENLTVAGWSDTDVAIGDRVRVGTAVLQVTEPRTPCFKLGLVFADSTMLKAFAAVAVSGWYYRVVEPGTIGRGDALIRLDRPNPDWTITRFFAAITAAKIDDATLHAIVALDGVSGRWRLKAERLLARRGAV